MSSPQAPSVASTAAVTRSHTPTKEDGGNSSDENEQEEKLPEKVGHALRSQVYTYPETDSRYCASSSSTS